MNKLKVLMVDDESRMRKLVNDFLSRKNYEVIEAGDGEEAMDSYDFTVLLIKFSLSVLIAGLTLWASRFLKH